MVNFEKNIRHLTSISGCRDHYVKDIYLISYIQHSPPEHQQLLNSSTHSHILKMILRTVGWRTALCRKEMELLMMRVSWCSTYSLFLKDNLTLHCLSTVNRPILLWRDYNEPDLNKWCHFTMTFPCSSQISPYCCRANMVNKDLPSSSCPNIKFKPPEIPCVILILCVMTTVQNMKISL